MLSPDEQRRYNRHIILDEIGEEGQLRLKRGSVLVVGAGGLGSPVLLYLAAAGVGRIGVADGDVVDESNLQRQVIHTTPEVGRLKVESARDKMLAINPNIQVETYGYFLTADNIDEIIGRYDFVVDATDGFESKYLISDACVRSRKPMSYGGIYRLEGQLMTYVPGSACFRCVFPEKPAPGMVKPCSQVGVLGAIAGMVGTMQAAEAIKYLTGVGELLTNRLLRFDAAAMQFVTLGVKPSPACPSCATIK